MSYPGRGVPTFGSAMADFSEQQKDLDAHPAPAMVRLSSKKNHGGSSRVGKHEKKLLARLVQSSVKAGAVGSHEAIEADDCHDIECKCIAGSDEAEGEGGFKSPFGVDWNTKGELLIADTENSAVKIVSTTGGSVRSLVNKGQAIKTPVGLCEDPSNGDIYVCDIGSFCIFRIPPGGSPQIFSGDGVAGYKESDGNEPARFDLPWDCCMNKDGDLVVCDRANHVIRKVHLADTKNHEHSVMARTSLLAGIPGKAGTTDGHSQQATFDAPSAIVCAPDGSLYVSDANSGRIRWISPGGKTVMTLPGVFPDALGIALDATGRLYIAHTQKGQILRYDPGALGTPYCIAGGAGQIALNKPTDIVVDSSSGCLVIVDGHAVKMLSSNGIKCLPVKDELARPRDFSSDLLCLVNKPKSANFADCTVKVGGEEFAAHRAILLTRAPGLRTLFGLPELQPPKPKVKKVEEVPKKEEEKEAAKDTSDDKEEGSEDIVHGDSRDTLDGELGNGVPHQEEEEESEDEEDDEIDVSKAKTEVEITDFSADAWLAFMVYLYSGKVMLRREIAPEVLRLASNYNCPWLVGEVEAYLLKHHTSIDDVLNTLAAAHLNNAENLKEACLHIVVRNFKTLQPKFALSDVSKCPDLLTHLICSIPHHG